MDFKNKVVLITGASSGIGKQTAIEFAKLGSSIILVARRKNKLEQVENELKQFNVNTLVCVCDVSKKDQVEELSKIVLQKFNSIDILVNNAGFAIYGLVSDLSINEIESQMETNYFGMIYCVKNFLPLMLKKKSGHIVNVASIGASFGVPGVSSYCATKFAMLGFSEGLKHELYGTGVGLTVVSPIMVRTPLFEHPSFTNFSKFSTGVSLSSETVAKTIIKASNSSRLEIVVPSVARVVIWFKQTFPFLINPIVGRIFRKQLTKKD
ncbi:MAG: SDR family NAD(P)-dependent oxidoreductase [Candidatus Nitrosopelagicus sp.]|nr:SDR family NAD(P)-dependent oxidoreductase [Candidatus Nitrosopelagicus sp.]